MVESAPSDDAIVQKRRSTRIVQAVPISVTGVDALGQPFKERTTTVMVNCHGCKYQSKHYVPKNSAVTLEIPRPEADAPPREVQGRVIWVQRPRTVRELFQIGLEFETPGNVWGIAFPPEDWFPLPGEAGIEIPAPSAGAVVVPPKIAPTPGEVPATPSWSATPPQATQPTQPPPPAPSKIAVMPGPAAESGDLARQMAKLLAESQKRIDSTIQQSAESAVGEQVRAASEKLRAQLQQAVEKAVQGSVAQASSQAIEVITQQAAEQAARLVEEARKVGEQTAEELDARVRKAIDSAVGTSVSKAAELAIRQITQQAATREIQTAAERAAEEAVNRAVADRGRTGSLPTAETAQAQLEQWRTDLEETAKSVRAQNLEQISAETSEASRKWQSELDASLQNVSSKLSGQIAEVSRAAIKQAESDMNARGASLRASLDQAVDKAQKTLDSLETRVVEEQARVEQSRTELQETAKSTLEQTRMRLEAMLAFQGAELERRTEDVVAAKIQKLEPTLETSAQQIADRVAGEMEQKLAPQVERAQQVAEELANAEKRAQEIELAVRERIHAASEEALREALDHIRTQTAQYPAHFEESCRAALSKVEEELEAKSTETTHTTFEALYKASEWYQKKAQTTMQAALEKSVEQSTTTLREHAAETSRMLTSELEHYSRSYVEHAKNQMEEATKEVADDSRNQLIQTAQTAAASFEDEIHRVAKETVKRFEDSSRESFKKVQEELAATHNTSLAEFQKRMDQRIVQGVAQAQKYLESQLLPLIDTWQHQRETEQQAWLEQLKRRTDESIDQYKARLENASNSWLLASATTLGQHSQAVLETLGKVAEKRLRETCADVLSGLGETLRAKLLGLSTDFGPEKKPPEKK